ncbi:50S ribosomal protein L1 [bacterium]|nr:50S ribosomal protein L1 [bacterium]
MKRGKKYRLVSQVVDRSLVYPVSDAVRLIQQHPVATFDETLEVHFHLGIDPRQADQQIRGTLDLPHGTGKATFVLVVAQGEMAMKATEAGADVVGSDDVIERISGGWLGFDVMIATPDMMAKLGKLGKLLGARGLMPNPKSGTVTTDVAQAVKGFKGGRVEYRNDKLGNIHLGIGKLSFSEEKLVENFQSIYDTIVRIKPSKSKGIYLRSVSLSSTMGPGLFVENARMKRKEAK